METITLRKLPNLKPNITKEEFDYLLSPEVVLKKIGFVFLALLILTLILIPVSVIVYVSFKNNFARTLMITFIVILVFFSTPRSCSRICKEKGL